jgi:hypothetical protein
MSFWFGKQSDSKRVVFSASFPFFALLALVALLAGLVAMLFKN